MFFPLITLIRFKATFTSPASRRVSPRNSSFPRICNFSREIEIFGKFLNNEMLASVKSAEALILLLISVFDHSFILTFLLIFSLKCIPEYLLIHHAGSFFRKKDLLWLFLFAQLFYMVYVCLIGTVSVFGSYTWKERKVKPTVVKLPAA